MFRLLPVILRHVQTPGLSSKTNTQCQTALGCQVLDVTHFGAVELNRFTNYLKFKTGPNLIKDGEMFTIFSVQYTSSFVFWIILDPLFRRCIYRVSQEECARLREGVPYVKVYRYNPKHLCPKLNGYGDNYQRKVCSSGGSTHCTCQLTTLSMSVLECGVILQQFSSRLL